MGDKSDSWAGRKRKTGYCSVPLLFSLAILTFIIIFPISKAQGIEGSVNYIWEERKREDEKKSKFTQIYDLILSRRLRPLYDASLKFEFRSETKENEQDREKTQLFPSLNMRIGNEMTNLNLGWSEDIITEDIITDTDTAAGMDREYTHERIYAGLNWRPKWLPHILLQFQGHKREREESGEEESSERDERITFIEEYTLRFGPLTFEHNFDHEIREIDGNETTTYDLLNKGNISHRFSFFEDRVYMSTGYELIQDREKEEDGNTIDTWKQRVNFSIIGYPSDWMRPEYRAFWGDIKTGLPDRRETTIEHDLDLLFIPHPYFSYTLGMYYNWLDRGLEYLPPTELRTFSLKLEPQIKGLIFDPNMSMYPTKTSILMSRSTEESEGYKSRIYSFLFAGSTTVYQGVDLDLDLSLVRWRNFRSDSRRIERRVDSYLGLEILPTLKGSINQKAKWTTNKDSEGERRNFDGDIESRLIYRPVNTFMFDAAYIFYYDKRDSGWQYSDSWQYSISWRPSSKVEIDMRYLTRREEREGYFVEGYFVGELNLNITHTIHLDLRYQSPSDDQRLKAEFKLRF